MTPADLLTRKPRPRIFVACSGAGAGIQQRLWAPPGASAYLVGAAFPYAAEETARFLGYEPASYCSEDEAIELAMASFMRAAAASTLTDEPIGVGLSASVASLKPHRGDHRIHAAVVTPDRSWVYSQTLQKGAGGDVRAGDGFAADDAARILIQYAIGELKWPGAVAPIPEVRLRSLLFARPFFDCAGRRFAATEAGENRRIMFPGSFNPIHAGHRAMASEARSWYGAGACYYITAGAPHKASLSAADLLSRTARILADHGNNESVLLTEGDSLYADKCKRFPGRTWLIGADAFDRLLDPKWGINPHELLDVFLDTASVFRVYARGHLDLASIVAACPGEMGEKITRLCVAGSGAWDVSSTEIRAKGATT